MTDLSGKTALITGSSRGIGKAIALRYAQLGANVVVNHLDEADKARQTLAEIAATGSDAIGVEADVSKPDEIERLFEAVIDRFDKVDIVVANAGIEIIDQPISETTEEQYDRLFAINSKGAFFTMQKAAKYVTDGGRIIHIGSSTTCGAVRGVGLYGSSKMSSRYVVEVLAQEVGNRAVTVNGILPTAVAGAGVFTDVGEDHPLPKLMKVGRPIEGRMGSPDDVADAAEYFASDLARWVSGQHLLISGGAQQ